MLRQTLAAYFLTALLGCTPTQAQNAFPTPDGRTAASGSVQMCINGSAQAVPCGAEGVKAGYRAGFTVAPAASATDIFTVTGSATKTIRITRVAVSGTASTGIANPVEIVRRSTADTGGTSADQSGNIAKLDSALAANTATVTSYSANPTLGNTAGRFALAFVYFGLTTERADQREWIFGTRGAPPVTLRGTSEQLAGNLSGGTIAGGSIRIEIEWYEE